LGDPAKEKEKVIVELVKGSFAAATMCSAQFPDNVKFKIAPDTAEAEISKVADRGTSGDGSEKTDDRSSERRGNHSSKNEADAHANTETDVHPQTEARHRHSHASGRHRSKSP
jgi:hypothetical protein